jgi:hypothetical protein
MRDFPRVAVGIGESARIAARERRPGSSSHGRPGVLGLGDDRIDLGRGAYVVG